jgi:hypothetical protein
VYARIAVARPRTLSIGLIDYEKQRYRAKPEKGTKMTLFSVSCSARTALATKF